VHNEYKPEQNSHGTSINQLNPCHIGSLLSVSSWRRGLSVIMS